MRLVSRYLFQRSALWSFMLTCLAFSLLVLCQFALTDGVNYVNSASHALYFGAVFGSALVVVQWRTHMGDTILEGLGYPKWSVAALVSVVSVILMGCAISQQTTRGLFETKSGGVAWHGQRSQLEVSMLDLETDQQREVFEKIRNHVDINESLHIRDLVSLLIPFLLNWTLVTVTRSGDYWLPLILTAMTFGGLEFWIRSYG